MKIGISNKINQIQLRFYERFYDVAPSPNYCDDIRLLKPSHGLIFYSVARTIMRLDDRRDYYNGSLFKTLLETKVLAIFNSN